MGAYSAQSLAFQPIHRPVGEESTHLCVYWFGNFTPWETHSHQSISISLLNIHCSSLSHRGAGSTDIPDEVTWGHVSRHFPNGCFILLRGPTDQHLINRKAAVYLHTRAEIALRYSVTTVQSTDQQSRFQRVEKIASLHQETMEGWKWQERALCALLPSPTNG